MRTKKEVMYLYNKHTKIIDRTIERNFNSPSFLISHGITQEEMYQAGRIGLYRACCDYDPSKKIKFQTYAINIVKWTIMTEAKRESLGRKGKWTTDLLERTSFDTDLKEDRYEDVETLHDVVGEDDYGYIEIEENDSFNYLSESVLDDIKNNISEHMCKTIQLKMQGMTNQQVADTLGVTHQAVSVSIRRHKDTIKKYILQ